MNQVNPMMMQGWNNTQPTQLYIGIDCGVSTGLAIWNKSKQGFDRVSTVMIHIALAAISELHKTNKIHVTVEDARKAGYRPKTDKDRAKAVSQAQGAGSVKRDASIWEDFLTDHKIPHEMKAPNYRLTKMNKEMFARATKYTGLTSNHSRDAAMLVWQK